MSSLRSKTSSRSTPAKSSTPKKASKASARKQPHSAATKLARKSSPASRTDQIVQAVNAALADIKAVNIKVLDVRALTDIADVMVVASGNSDRHVRSIAERVVQFAKKQGFRPSGIEGERDGEWALVDLQDVIVHVMLPRVRDFYRLESLWDVSAAARHEREAV